MPERIYMNIITRKPTRKAAFLNELIGEAGLAPQFTSTHFATQDGVPLRAFYPDTFVKQLSALKSDESIALIARKKDVKYEGSIDLRNDGNAASISLTFGSESD